MTRSRQPNRRQRPLKGALLVALAALLAACGRPATVDAGPPTFTPDSTAETLAEVNQEVLELSGTLRADDAARALASLPSFPLGRLTTLDRLGDPGSVTYALPRGIWHYDAAARRWRLTVDAGALELNWPLSPGRGPAQLAQLIVDWDAGQDTVAAKRPDGAWAEVPERASARLVIAGVPAGALELQAGWYESACGLLLEPRDFTLSGDLGRTQRLVLEALSWRARDLKDGATQLDTAGTLTATRANGQQRARLSWQLSATAILRRDPTNCAVTGAAEVRRAEVTLALELQTGAPVRRLALAASLSGSGAGPTVEEGTLRLGERTALSFAGRLDDANGNLIPGENLTLTFADGRSTDLETFLIGLWRR